MYYIVMSLLEEPVWSGSFPHKTHCLFLNLLQISMFYWQHCYYKKSFDSTALLPDTTVLRRKDNHTVLMYVKNVVWNVYVTQMKRIII